MLSGHTRSGLSSVCLSADVNECAVVGACGPDSVCMNTVGSFRCECGPGYHTTSLGRHCRGALPHQTKFCRCFPVLTLSMCLFVLCVCVYMLPDIDECVEADPCFRGKCLNLPGSYTCVCSQGFRLNDNKTDCQGESCNHTHQHLSELT